MAEVVRPMLKKLKNIRLRPLISHVLITLAYPAVRAVTSPTNKLLVFTDAMTIIALVLIIGGVVYSTVLHGDYDISGFVLNRGAKKEMKQDFAAYQDDRKKRRAEAFNYPLFLGIVYIIASAIIAYLLL